MEEEEKIIYSHDVTVKEELLNFGVPEDNGNSWDLKPSPSPIKKEDSFMEMSISSDTLKTDVKEEQGGDVEEDKEGEDEKELSDTQQMCRTSSGNKAVGDNRVSHVLNVEEEAQNDDDNEVGYVKVGDSYECMLCPYRAQLRTNLLSHIRKHTEKIYKCDLCPFETAWKSALRRHMHSKTTHRQQQEPKIHSPKVLKCQDCPYQTCNKSDLRVHLRVHTHERPFACNLCSYRGAQKIHLTVHMRRHTLERPFTCIFCPYRTTTSSSLKLHTRIHTLERPYKCTFCQYRAARKMYLRAHIKNVHRVADTT